MNKRCIILTSYLEGTIIESIDIKKDDYVICADGGFVHALKENVVPNIVIGDFDSCSYDLLKNTIDTDSYFKETEIIKTKPEKDDTDTLMCVKHAIEKDMDEFVIIGGIGGRTDHTIANIQTLSFILDNGRSAWIVAGHNKVTMIQGPDRISLYKDDADYFSIYSFSDNCTGVYEINAKYLLENVTLSQSNPMGTSNEFLDGPATVKVETGKLLIVLSKNQD